MIEFWGGARHQRRGPLRLRCDCCSGEMSWLERVPPERRSVVRYETWADEFVVKYPQTVLCLYDLRKLGSGILMDLLRTHRLLLGRARDREPAFASADRFSAA